MRNIMLLASTAFAVVTELFLLPWINSVVKGVVDSRWTIMMFVGAVMFVAACANVIYREDLKCLTCVQRHSHSVTSCRIADRTASRHLWVHVTSSVT